LSVSFPTCCSSAFVFFFLGFGRCRSEARSLHEHKLSKRCLYKDTVGPYEQANQDRNNKKPQDHQTTTTRKSPSQTCVSSEKAANQTKNQTKHKQKRGRNPNTTPTRSICQGTQWFDHCITFKNMRNELKSRQSSRHESLASLLINSDIEVLKSVHEHEL